MIIVYKSKNKNVRTVSRFPKQRDSCASIKINWCSNATEKTVAVTGYLVFLQQVYPQQMIFTTKQLYIHITEFMTILFAEKYCVLLTTRIR